MDVVLKLTVLLIVVNGRNSLAMRIKCSDEIAVGNTVWNCSDSNIFEFPNLSIHPGIEILDFSFNQINHIPKIDQEITDKNCPGHIQKLYLQHNQIKSLDNDTFYNLKCLTYLDLSYNQLSGVDFNENIFHGLLNLITLNISYNPLMVLKNFSMEHSSVAILEHFEAVNCQLGTIEPESLNQLSFLRSMNLSHNSLSSVNSHLFNHLNFLCRLDLSYNKLTDITNQTFYPLLALKHLHLDSNQISKIQDGAFHGLTRMSHLSLRNNTLSKFPFEPLRPAIALKELDISANLIASFNKYSGNVIRTKMELFRMEDMPRLRYIGAHSTTVFPHLKYLYLRNNHALNKIAPEAFTESFKSLQYVYINDNGLTTIDKDTFPWSSLLDLDWSGNPWACDCYLKWVVTFHSVNKTLKCHTPTKFKGRDLLELHPLDLKCPRSLVIVFLAFAISITVALAVAILFILWRYKHRFRCLRRNNSRYRSVYTNEREDEDGRASIELTPEDERPLTSGGHVTEND
ncbi:leucine-rich repeat neuronal protein 2 [Patella vulgata]|uniref:leucine-rich repeat neuronal protein 2 n=1 Tax=Patella vulgata TaxID=6465 RepID=UPI0024A9DDF0|nr:leucine-rich repeat neuronal protein 2 [Patella vulgata]